jgi:NAD(P)-dependent dehydrogenase (short-subunit alcohol dehydrogenase family)
MTDFTQKVFLVTGVTSGIGRATASHLAQLGARVVGAARSEEAGRAWSQELQEAGSEASFVTTDVTSSEQVGAMVDFTLERYGRLDCAFNNAGIFVPEQPLHEHDEQTWQSVLAVNLTSVYHCMKHELRAMLDPSVSEDSSRVIVNNASIIGHRGSSASGLAYTAAKHGVIGLTRQAAVTYADRGIRVNAVSPGPVLTAATRSQLDLHPDELKSRLSTLNPTGELVAVEDVARTVAFLCSEAAGMINGYDIPLDGGQLAKL